MSLRTVCKTASFCSLFVTVICQAALAQDWPQWRGPARDGAVTGFRAPKAWPEQLKAKWKVTVGEGHSSPVVAGGRVFQHSRQGDKEVVSAFDLNTGKLLWTDSYPVAYTMNPAATGHGKGPKSTPVISNGKLYTLGITGVLSCYDTAAGKLRWRKEFGTQFKTTSPYFGTAMSPIVDKGLLIAHVGGHDSGALMAFDAESGAVKWQWNGDGPGYASPIIVDIKGTRQIITQSQQNIVGIWADNGGLLWKIPFDTAYVQNIVTPVAYKDLLIFSGIDKGVFAVRPVYRNGQWGTEQVWKNDEVSLYMSSPILGGNQLLGMSHKKKGQFFSLDAATGKTLWAGDGRQGENAALVIAGDVMFWLTNDAQLIVSRLTSKGVEPIRRYKVADSATWAHPAVVGNRVLIKDATTLAMLVTE
ncbi:MAG TPA: PQQ-binding-like beta-propeller repeat protein [Blastocatellia bacterium]|nr:PQQ-binding-like beta-propeller repeat protein [Blastocatellia bacterium]